jgi:uncharacterized protein (TIGR03437 family)
MRVRAAGWFIILGIVASTVESGEAQPAVTAVVNAASFDTAVPRGCLISIFGTRLARAKASAVSVPPPNKLEDAMVLVGDLQLAAPLYFVSPTQINAQLPFEALGDTLSIVVTTAEGASKPFLLKPAAYGPGLFTRDGSGKGPALAFTPDFQPVDSVSPGQSLILYATGLGPTDPPVLSGNPGATQEPLNRVTTVPEVYMGDYSVPAPVAFAGLAPGLPGVYQINVTPQILATDRLYLRSGGQLSNMVQIPLKAGQNVSNASGTIEVVYPTAQVPITWTPYLMVVRITARMNIGAAAGPFAIAAVTDGFPSAVITVDPENGTYQGSMPVPTQASHFEDFSSSSDIRYDLLTCSSGPNGGTAIPFPGNILPLSRIPLQEPQILSQLPLPDTLIPRSAVGLLTVKGQATRASIFAIDGSNNSALATFAAYIPVGTPCAQRGQTTTVRLLIDGTQVASTDVPWSAGPFSFPGGPQ